MQCAVQKFAEDRQNGLLLIDMPTGTGKTYQTKELIKKFIKGEALKEVPCVIYLTPLKKNIEDIYNDLRRDFQNENDLETFDANVLRIYANFECVRENLLSVESQIPERLRFRDSFKNLKQRVQTIIQLENDGAQKDIVDTIIMEARKVYEPAFRRDLCEEIARDCKSEKSRKKKLRDKEFSWVKTLYPSCLTDDRKVLFMTMDKFISGNDPIISKPYRFISHRKTKGALIFIDEFDSTKDVVLDNEIQRCTDYKIDLVKLFSGIANTLKGRVFPEALFGDSDEAKTSFNKMKQVILDVEKRYNLNYLFKFESKGNTDRYFLFDDYRLHTISSKDDKQNIIVKTDIKKMQNTITITDEPSNGEFFRTIYGMKGALNYFIRCCALLARNYHNHYNDIAKTNNSDMMEIEQAVSTIVGELVTDSNLVRTVSTLVVDNVSIPAIENKRDVLDSDFYMDGFRYYDFVDDISHDISTTISMCYLDNTPEKYILSLASKARIVGLSATGTIKTVTGNYNLDYLQEKLQSNYYTLSAEDSDRIRKLVSSRIKHDYNITVTKETVECGDESETKDIIAQLFKDPANIEKFVGLLLSYKQVGQNPFYNICRFIKTMKAVRDFMNSQESRALLVLTNRNIRKNGENIFSVDNASEIVKALSKELNIIAPQIHFLQGADFGKQKDSYKQDIILGRKVIIFTSYNTAGVGQNLQYEIDDKETDIDSIYVELPTNILVNAREMREEQSMIEYIYQMETLKTNGELSTVLSMSNIKSAFRKIIDHNSIPHFDHVAYSTESYNNHIVKTLMQAIGRICRTGNKHNNSVNIFIDDEIYKKVDFSLIEKENRIVNPEFKKIVKLNEKEATVEPSTHKNLNKAAERNERMNSIIEKLLSDNKESWDSNDMLQWEKIREVVLKYPTISIENLLEIVEETNISSLKDCYLYARDGEEISRYFYKEGDYNKPILYDFGNKDADAIVIDAFNSRLVALMRIPAVKDYFKAHGYAMSFEPNKAIILPVIYQNIYKGALGEAAGRAILESHGIKLSPIIDPAKFEKFDYCLEDYPDIYIDFKNWSGSTKFNLTEYRQKCIDKLHKIGGRKVFIINVEAIQFNLRETAEMVEISSLVKPNNSYLYELDPSDMKKVIRKFVEAMEDGAH